MTIPDDCWNYHVAKRTPPWPKGHSAPLWLLNHGDEPQHMEYALDRFRQYDLAAGARGHIALRNIGGHWVLEMRLARQTTPFPLAMQMADYASDALLWYFDPDQMLSDPEWPGREIGEEEIKERVRAYQEVIDKERGWGMKAGYLLPPPLYELPDEQQRRLVYHWERLWWDFLDLHPNWRWTPNLGFYQTTETIFPLVDPAGEWPILIN